MCHRQAGDVSQQAKEIQNRPWGKAAAHVNGMANTLKYTGPKIKASQIIKIWYQNDENKKKYMQCGPLMQEKKITHGQEKDICQKPGQCAVLAHLASSSMCHYPSSIILERRAIQ